VNAANRKRLTLLVGALLGALAVGFMLKAVVDQWSKVSDAIANANWSLLALGLVLAVASMAHLGVLWGDALPLFGHPKEPRRRVVVWWFVGELGKYVPGGVLSVVGRAEVARRNGVSRTAAYGSVPLSLVLRYFAGMLAFAALLPFDLANQGSTATYVVLALVPLGLLALHPKVVGWCLAKARKVSKKQLDLPVPTWRESVTEVLAYVPNWVLIIASTWCTARAFTPDPNLLRIALATLLSWTIGFLVFPIPAGAGIREAVFSASAGLPHGLGVVVAIASRLMFILADGFGAAICSPILRRQRAADARARGQAPPDDDDESLAGPAVEPAPGRPVP
jgi:uncharacterized membrane protein YbhN (UPF0104 family)